MRSVAIVVFLLGLLAAHTFAQCSLHFDDCEKCLSDPKCGWCGDFCSSIEDSICDQALLLDSDKCPEPIQASRAVDPCAALSCSQCQTDSSCVFCVIAESGDASNVYSSGCLSADASFLCSNSYAQPGTQEFLSNTCPAPDGATRQFFIVVAGSGSYDFFAEAIATNFSSYKNLELKKTSLPDLQVGNVFIVALGPGSKRSDASGLALRQANTRVEFTVVSPNPTSYPQATLESDVDTFVNQLDSLAGLTVTDKGSSEINGGGSSSGGSSGDDVNLSGGEMAGIVIACIVGAAIIAAVAAYIILKKRGGASYPAPFRSPAASFRP
jgi:hypothetical protein